MAEPLPRAETPVTEPATEPAAESKAAPAEPRKNETEVPVPTPLELARDAFDKALLTVHQDFGPLEKTRPVYRDKPHEVERMLREGKNPPVKYYFADLTDVLNLTDPVLQENGLYHRTDVEQTDGGDLRYTLTLTHEAGYSIQGVYELNAPAGATAPHAHRQRDALHAHAHRYLLGHVLGLSAGPDPEHVAAPVDENAANIFGGVA